MSSQASRVSPAKVVRQAAQMNWFERSLAAISPAFAYKRMAYRVALAAAGGYEGGRASRMRKTMRDDRSPDSIVGDGGCKTRNYARHLERNHDLARGALRVMVRNIVGANGITVEPMPRKADGKVHNDFADQIMRLYKAWSRAPEVTRTRDWAMTQRDVCRAWLRDGEEFTQLLPGQVIGLTHGSPVPLSLELLEADLVPMEFDDFGKNIRQGIQCNAWGAAVVYHVYKTHPNDGFSFAAVSGADLKQVPSSRMLHVALRDRLSQRRGITLFAAVVNRLEDLKEIADYEIAAGKLAAALTAVIKRDPSFAGPDPSVLGETSGQGRDLMRIEPGMVFDGAQPGEEIQVIDSKRPNSGVPGFIDWNMRGVAAGIDGSYSSISRNYNGTYSAQRQELVEVWESYRALRGDFVGYFVRPVYEEMVSAAIAAGLLRIPSDLDPYTLFDADFRGPAMPWIQPVQEANAELVNVRAGFKSLTQVVRERGGNPWDTLEQIEEERREAAELGLVLESDPANDLPGPADVEPGPDEQDNAQREAQLAQRRAAAAAAAAARTARANTPEIR
jgi:lambda family phage portal protein